MADVHLPATLPPLFDQLPRRLDVEAGSVDEVIARLDERWPGMRGFMGLRAVGPRA